jgi:hypothetical protein
MARVRGAIATSGAANPEVAYTASHLNSRKTILQLIVPAGHMAAVKGFSISFDGTSVSAQPAQVWLIRQSSAGTGGTAISAYEESRFLFSSLQCSGSKGIWATSEPSDLNTNVPLRVYNVHPQTGIEVRFNADDEILVGSSASISYLGLCLLSDAAVNCLAHLSFEE